LDRAEHAGIGPQGRQRAGGAIVIVVLVQAVAERGRRRFSGAGSRFSAGPDNIGIAYMTRKASTMLEPVISQPTLTLPTRLPWLGGTEMPRAVNGTSASAERAASIGTRIAQLRKERGLTQKELAERLAVTQPVVSDYENDVIRIPADVVVAIAKILAVSTDELLGLKPEARSAAAVKNRRLSRRLQAIDALPKRDQESLLGTIDAFISKSV
jgi:transcriptional regulator with XRE-family HTH domain